MTKFMKLARYGRMHGKLYKGNIGLKSLDTRVGSNMESMTAEVDAVRL